MQDAMILGALRTPVGRIRGGLSSVRPDDLLAHVLTALVKKSGVDPAAIDEVFAGCANQAGEDNRNVARMAALLAGFPYEVPAITLNRLCASGLDAVIQAARSIWVGDNNLVIAGGVESMTRAPLVMSKGDDGFAGGNRVAFDTSLGWRFPNSKLEARFPLEPMGETAENLAERYGIGRQEQDELALRSHQRAVAAWDAGRFDAEVTPVDVPVKKSVQTFKKDEGPRVDSSLEKLASLAPAFRKGGTVTAGNSSTLNDGAAAILIGSREQAQMLGIKPMARVVACASAAVDPRFMGIGPVPATRKALARAGMTAKDLDLIEINEAFAVQTLAVMRELEVDREHVNVNGGAIALGHPLGCSGARILTTLVHELVRRNAQTGLASLCVGVGQGVSVIVRRD